MAYQSVNRLPDRYKVVFQNAQNARQRVWITADEFTRRDRDAHVLKTYTPSGWVDFTFWYVPYIETFDTPSRDLESGMVWEGLRDRTNPNTKQRQAVPLVMWRDLAGQEEEASADEVVMTRNGGVVETIVRKRQA